MFDERQGDQDKEQPDGWETSSFQIPDWWRIVLMPSSLKDLLTSDSTFSPCLSIGRWMESENELFFFTAAQFCV